MRIIFLCSEDFSLGVTSLSSYLKKHDHEVFLIFDPKQFNKAYSKNNYLSIMFSREKYIIEQIKDLKPDIIGFSVFTASYIWASGLARKIKEELDIPIIFGGIHPTLVPEYVIKNEFVDMVCIGEGEEPLLELLNSLERGEKNFSIKNIWFKDNGEVIKNPIRPLVEDLDSMPFPDRQLFYNNLPASYRENPIILTSRGCSFRCSYCANNAIAKIYRGQGKYLRQRSPENVIAELEELIADNNVKYVIFMDDVFTANKKWIREFIPMYREKIKKPFSCLTHPKFLTQEIVDLLKGAGCNIILMGLQSGCEEIRKKSLKRFESNEDFRKAAGYCRNGGIRFSADAILNLPYDNPMTLKESLEFYSEIRPDIIHCFGLVYFPKTEIIDIAINAGMMNEEFRAMINEGSAPLYMSVVNGSNLKRDYKKYALLFTIIPLFPQRLMKTIIDNYCLLSLVGKMPISLILPAKFILNMKAGTGFIYFSVLRNEIYYALETFRMKIGMKMSGKN